MGNCYKNSTTLHFWEGNCSATFKTELPSKGLNFHLLDSDFQETTANSSQEKNAGYFLRLVLCWNFQLFSTCFEFLAASCSSVVLKIQPPIVLENEKNLKLTLVFHVSVSKFQVSSQRQEVFWKIQLLGSFLKVEQFLSV